MLTLSLHSRRTRHGPTMGHEYKTGCQLCGGQPRMRAHAGKNVRFRYELRHTSACRLYDGTVLWAAELERKIGHELPDPYVGVPSPETETRT